MAITAISAGGRADLVSMFAEELRLPARVSDFRGVSRNAPPPIEFRVSRRASPVPLSLVRDAGKRPREFPYAERGSGNFVTVQRLRLCGSVGCGGDLPFELHRPAFDDQPGRWRGTESAASFGERS